METSKPGVKTSEFWLCLSALGALVAQVFGFGNVTGELQSSIGSLALAVVSAWLGSNYVASRLQLKSGDSLLANAKNALTEGVQRELATLRERLAESGEQKAEPPARHLAGAAEPAQK